MQFDPWFFDAVSGPSAIIDSEGTILSVNEDWQRFATENGAATDAGKDRFALGANYLEVCSKASGQQSKGAISVADGIRSVMKGETPQFVHEYPCHAPQQQRWFKCLVRALPDTVDKGKTFLIQHVEVTDQVQSRHSAEGMMRKYRERLAELIEAVPVWVANIGTDMVYRFVNEEFARGVGLTKAEIRGKTPMDIVGPKAWKKLQPLMTRTLMGETVTFEADIKLYSGQSLQAIITYIPDRQPSGEIMGLYAFIQDISEQKQRQNHLHLAMQAAEQANHAKSRFLASMSHELRTPLNAIIGFAEMISLQISNPADEEKQCEYARDILSSAHHLLSMVDDILDLSAIEDGKVSIDKQPIDLAEILEDCVKVVGARVAGNDLELQTHVPSPPPELHADERALRQVVLNLLTNAVKYTPAPGRISIDVASHGNIVQIQVTDTGIGIAPDRLERVTSAFSQGGHLARTGEKGWGLGLSISKALIELHGGRLRIDSEVEHGTTVTVTLPCCDHQPQVVPVNEIAV